MTNPFDLQLTIDCTNPHELAEWWAETLGWDVEAQDEAFIQSMIDQGFATAEETTRFRGALVFASGAAIAHPAEDNHLRIYFQQVPESKQTKNRLHFDLRPDTRDEAELDRIRQDLVRRGATELEQGQQGTHRWIVFADPEGNEFCL